MDFFWFTLLYNSSLCFCCKQYNYQFTISPEIQIVLRG